jgi:hypothetical protein
MDHDYNDSPLEENAVMKRLVNEYSESTAVPPLLLLQSRMVLGPHGEEIEKLC